MKYPYTQTNVFWIVKLVKVTIFNYDKKNNSSSTENDMIEIEFHVKQVFLISVEPIIYLSKDF